MTSLTLLYCGYCSKSYTHKDIDALHNLQCSNCLLLDSFHQISGFDDPCAECGDHTNVKFVFDCSHWFCNKEVCKRDACSICKHSNQSVHDIHKFSIFITDAMKGLYNKLSIHVHHFINNYVDYTTEVWDQHGYDNKYHKHMKVLKLLIEYHKWLQIVAKYDAHHVSPSPVIDKVWHAHIIDTHDYKRVCQIINGNLIHHYPQNSYKSQQDEQLVRYHSTLKYYQEMFDDMDYYTKRDYWYLPNFVLAFHDRLSEGCIFIKANHGKTNTSMTIALPFHTHLTGQNIMDMIDEKENIPPIYQRLVYAGHLLDPSRCLYHAYGIRKETTLHLIVH